MFLNILKKVRVIKTGIGYLVYMIDRRIHFRMELIPFSRCLEGKSERKGKGDPPNVF